LRLATLRQRGSRVPSGSLPRARIAPSARCVSTSECESPRSSAAWFESRCKPRVLPMKT
jgi:hypothetical protein